jgi:hypothetical protein
LGALDLNKAEPQQQPGQPPAPSPHYSDVETLTHILRVNAPDWVPELFPRGRLDPDDKTLWRLANIKGDPPKKRGSCIVHLAGDKAGGWFDYETGKGGNGPASTIKESLGLSGAALIKKMAEYAERYAHLPAPPAKAYTNGHNKKDDGTAELREAAHALRQAGPAKSTLGETYLRSRGLIDPASPDLLFNGNTTHWKSKTGRPALIARFRYPSGEPTGGIHRIYLKPDGSGYTEKKMLGSPGDGAVIMLGQPDGEGTLGIGEGIESTLAAMQLYNTKAGWACASDGGMKRFAVWLRDNPASAKTLRVKRLLVWADLGKAGEGPAHEICTAARGIGLQCELYLPRTQGDGADFNDDVRAGLAPAGPEPDRDTADALSLTIAEFNERYAVVNESGKAVVYERARDPVLKRSVIVRIQFSDLKKLYQNKLVSVPNGRGGTTTKSAADWWLGHRDRRTYLDGVTFDPAGAVPQSCWNLWHGFEVDPAPGDWGLMKQHVYSVICCGNDDHFEYLLNWAARMFQQPNDPGEVAIVVRGSKGAGKGIFLSALTRAWGAHGIHIRDAKHLIGNFNAHLRDCVCLFADEAFFAGDRQHEGVLKGLVTERTLPIEGKGQNLITAPNMLHVIMSSNSDWVVPASHDERRYAALDAADNRIGNRKYFSDIARQMDAGGLAAMIYELLHRDISDFEVRDIPASSALAAQKKYSLDTIDRWWLAALDRGFVWRSRHGVRAFGQWDEFYSTELLSRSYLQWCAESRVQRPMTREQLGVRMASIYQRQRPRGEHIIGEVEVAAKDATDSGIIVKADRPPGFLVEDLDYARARFADIRGVVGEWGDEGI